jgi:AcrR family transcriptional regulator
MTKVEHDEQKAMARERPRLRADAVRNRERLLVAAARVFGAGAEGASLEAVAREAGVGIGTLYRHFPTRESLFEAVYRREVDQLVDLAARLALDTPPTDALRTWLRATVEFVATKKGMSAALAVAMSGTSDLTTSSSVRMAGALGPLLQRAAGAGEIRPDITPEEIMRALVGMCFFNIKPGWKESVLRLLDVLLDGLRKV